MCCFNGGNTSQASSWRMTFSNHSIHTALPAQQPCVENPIHRSLPLSTVFLSKALSNSAHLSCVLSTCLVETLTLNLPWKMISRRKCGACCSDLEVEDGSTSNSASSAMVLSAGWKQTGIEVVRSCLQTEWSALCSSSLLYICVSCLKGPSPASRLIFFWLATFP